MQLSFDKLFNREILMLEKQPYLSPATEELALQVEGSLLVVSGEIPSIPWGDEDE